MQAAQATKAQGVTRFTYTHIGIMALALILVVSSVTTVTTLGITGDLPWQQHGATRALPSASPRYVQLKEARQEALESHMGQVNRTVSIRPALPNALHRYGELKEARQEALELQMGQAYGSALAVSSAK